MFSFFKSKPLPDNFTAAREVLRPQVDKLQRLIVKDGKIQLDTGVTGNQYNKLVEILKKLYEKKLQPEEITRIYNAFLKNIRTLTSKNDAQTEKDFSYDNFELFKKIQPLVVVDEVVDEVVDQSNKKHVIYLNNADPVYFSDFVGSKYTYVIDDNNNIVFKEVTEDTSSNSMFSFWPRGGGKKSRRNLHKKSKKTRRARKTVKRGGRKSRK